MALYRHALPQLSGDVFLTNGGNSAAVSDKPNRRRTAGHTTICMIWESI